MHGDNELLYVIVSGSICKNHISIRIIEADTESIGELCILELEFFFSGEGAMAGARITAYFGGATCSGEHGFIWMRTCKSIGIQKLSLNLIQSEEERLFALKI